jgi:hypothetical protein
MSRPTAFLARSLAVAALVGGLAFSPNLYAATPANDAAPAATKEQKAMTPEARVEERIKELHDKLKITDEQATAWNAVADTMRDNEKAMQPLIQERHEKGGTRTAVEDLESYQKIAAAHADSLNKFIAVFQPLYDSMSDAQKKNADTVFGQFEGNEHMKGKTTGKTK